VQDGLRYEKCLRGGDVLGPDWSGVAAGVNVDSGNWTAELAVVLQSEATVTAANTTWSPTAKQRRVSC